jgi:hypothetical protein
VNRVHERVKEIEPGRLMVHMEGGSSGEEAAAGPLENMNVTLDSPEKASVVEERRGEAGGWNGSQRNEGNHRLRHTHQKFNRGNVPKAATSPRHLPA